jgi:cation transport protein ChaC
MPMRSLHLTLEHVTRATRPVEKVIYPSTFTPCTDADFADRVRRIVAGRPNGPLNVFAYGSLIWNPDFKPAARKVMTAWGWHRQFSMQTRGWRGTPDAPGLMMCLMSGGCCKGFALEVAEDDVARTVEALVRRETPNRENDVDWRWITVDGGDRKEQALVFWAGPSGPSIRRGIPLEAAAAQMARACGWRGSTAEYLHNTILSLEEHGILDSNLWRLQRLVAEEIDRLWPAGPEPIPLRG